MKCQQCEKSATFHITELSGGAPQELHLCEEHAHLYLAEGSIEAQHDPAQLAGMLAQHLVGESAEELAKLEKKACPDCGMTFAQFRKQGRLGCPNDYQYFSEQLDPLIANVHGALEHAGKVPRRAGGASRQQTDLIRLRREMKDAIAAEDYERASELRDEIRRVEEES